MTLNIHKLTHLSYSDIPPSMPRLPLLVIKYFQFFLHLWTFKTPTLKVSKT